MNLSLDLVVVPVLRCYRDMLELTRGLQGGNHVGDAGACGLGSGLKVNSSLRELHLVRDFMISLDL